MTGCSASCSLAGMLPLTFYSSQGQILSKTGGSCNRIIISQIRSKIENQFIEIDTRSQCKDICLFWELVLARSGIYHIQLLGVRPDVLVVEYTSVGFLWSPPDHYPFNFGHCGKKGCPGSYLRTLAVAWMRHIAETPLPGRCNLFLYQNSWLESHSLSYSHSEWSLLISSSWA